MITESISDFYSGYEGYKLQNPKQTWVCLKVLSVSVANSSERTIGESGFESSLCPEARHLIIPASSVDRDVKGGPVSRK